MDEKRFKALQAYWNAILESEGMPEELPSVEEEMRAALQEWDVISDGEHIQVGSRRKKKLQIDY